MDQGVCYKVTRVLINWSFRANSWSRLEITLTRHCGRLFGALAGGVRHIGRQRRGRQRELWAWPDVSKSHDEGEVDKASIQVSTTNQ